MVNNSTAIITFVSIRSETEYLVRTMRNVDEQTSSNWHHFIYCENEVLVNRAKSLISLRSSSYPNKVSIQLYSEYSAKNISEYAYVGIHPIRDTWGPAFLEKMVLELTSCPIVIAGVWCQYHNAQEVIRGKIISIDEVSPGPQYSGSLILPTYQHIRNSQFIQGLYYTADVPVDSFNITANPMMFAAEVLAEQDILTIHDTLAAHSVQRETPQSKLDFQQTRNTLFRRYPRMGVTDE